MPIKLDTWGQFVFIMADPSRCCGSFPVKPTFRMHTPSGICLKTPAKQLLFMNALNLDLWIVVGHRQGCETPHLALMTCAW